MDQDSSPDSTPSPRRGRGRAEMIQHLLAGRSSSPGNHLHRGAARGRGLLLGRRGSSGSSPRLSLARGTPCLVLCCCYIFLFQDRSRHQLLQLQPLGPEEDLCHQSEFTLEADQLLHLFLDLLPLQLLLLGLLLVRLASARRSARHWFSARTRTRTRVS